MILLSCTKLAVGEKIAEPRGTGPDGVRSIGFPGVRHRTALVSLPFRLMLLAVQERHLKYDRITTAAVMSVVFCYSCGTDRGRQYDGFLPESPQSDTHRPRQRRIERLDHLA